MTCNYIRVIMYLQEGKTTNYTLKCNYVSVHERVVNMLTKANNYVINGEKLQEKIISSIDLCAHALLTRELLAERGELKMSDRWDDIYLFNKHELTILLWMQGIDEDENEDEYRLVWGNIHEIIIAKYVEMHRVETRG